MIKHIAMIEKNQSGMDAIKIVKKLGHRITYFTKNTGNARVKDSELQYFDQIVTVDTACIDAVIDKASEIHAQYPFAAVTSFLEYYVPVAARVSTALGLTGLTPEAADNARNKARMREIFLACCVPSPRFVICTSPEEILAASKIIGFPCIIKPSDFLGSKLVFKATEPEMLTAYTEEIFSKRYNTRGEPLDARVLLEEYMEGPEFSVEGLVVNGVPNPVAVTQKTVTPPPIFVEMGHIVSPSAKDEFEKSIRQTAIQGCHALGLNNCGFHAEIKFTSEGPKIVEIAARLGGDYIPKLVRLSTGIDLVEQLINLLLGNSLHLEPNKFNHAGIRFIASKKGIFSRLSCVDQLEKHPFTNELSLSVKPGHQMRSLLEYEDRIAHVVAVAPSLQEIVEYMHYVEENVHVVLES